MLKKKFLFFLLIITFSFVFLSNITFSKESNYYKNLPDDSIKNIFDLDLKEVITDPFNWLKERETYIMVEETPDGEIIFWFNTPNVQTILFNSIDNLMPSGYIGNGIDPYEVAESKNYDNLMGDYNNPRTAQQRYGFDIPSPPYVGEYPKITMNLMEVFVEKNHIKFFFHKIGASLFGTNAIEPPSNKVLASLEYLSPNDYTYKNSSFQNWISLYWDIVISNMPEELILINEEFIDNKKLGTDKNGISWIKKNIFESGNIPEKVGNIKGVNTPKDIDLLLQEFCGPNYVMVIKNIMLWGIENDLALNISNIPERIMPYQRDTLRNEDKQALLVDDPRVKGYNTNLTSLGLPINLNFSMSSVVKNKIASMIINSAGTLSRWTILLNSITNFSLIESTKDKNPQIDVMKMWKSPISIFIIIMSLGILVFILLKQIISLLKGEQGLFKILVRSFSSLFIIGLISFFAIAPDSFFSLIKNVSNFFFNMGTQTMMSTDLPNKFIKDNATTEEKINCSYWLPYFSLWTKYNTGALLTDKSNIIDINNLNNEPEQQAKTKPWEKNRQSNDITSSDYNHTWACILADSFTEGFIIKNKAYRVVDHFMAPRIKYNGKNLRPIITATENENYNGKIQRSIDIGIYSLILLVLIGVFIKFLLYMEFIYELIMIQINLAMSSINQRLFIHTMKRFACSIIRIGIWDFVICMIIYITLYTSGLFSFILFCSIIFLIYTIIKKLSLSNSIWSPRIMAASYNFISNHRGVR